MMCMVLKVLSIHVDGILNITQPSLPDIMQIPETTTIRTETADFSCREMPISLNREISLKIG